MVLLVVALLAASMWWSNQQDHLERRAAEERASERANAAEMQRIRGEWDDNVERLRDQLPSRSDGARCWYLGDPGPDYYVIGYDECGDPIYGHTSDGDPLTLEQYEAAVDRERRRNELPDVDMEP